MLGSRTDRDLIYVVLSDRIGHTSNARSRSVNCQPCDEKPRNNRVDDEDKPATTTSILKLLHLDLFLLDNCAEIITLGEN